MAKPESIQCPPFPTLMWDEFYWSAPYTLPAWTGFQSRGGDYCSIDSNTSSDGTINLVVSTDTETRTSPTVEQIDALVFLSDNDAPVAATIVRRIYDEYPAIRERYADFLDPDELVEDMPEISSPDGLEGLIGLSNIHIHRKSRDGVAYVGYELGCTWDIEHGLGLMLHRDRIIEFGGADTAILEWIADQDAGV